MDFDTAWDRARKNGDMYAPLFATSSYASSHYRPNAKITIRKTPVRHYMPSTSSSAVWSEFSGHSSQKGYMYSPALFKVQHQHAIRAFAQAEYILSKAKAQDC